MPSLISSVHRFDASSMPENVLNILRANPARANTILPHAEKVLGIQGFTPRIAPDGQLWLVYSNPGASVKFILSCTEGPMGKYPVYIIPTVPTSKLTPELLKDSMEAFCDALLSDPDFSKRRVFSVFSVDLVAEAFAGVWGRRTNIKRIEEPYYDAIFSTCSNDTLAPVAPSPADVVTERLAVEQDAQKIAILCEEFAATSPPFILSPENAYKEAEILIMNKQVWVLEIRDCNGELDIASIVAVTRKSKDVATITKVYTPAKWRGRRCAGRLVHHVCGELLNTYEQVALYVGVDNGAKKVYSRVGFQGLTEGSSSSGGVERWLEIGFDQAEVDLGHW